MRFKHLAVSVAALLLLAGSVAQAASTVGLFGKTYDVTKLTLTGAAFGANTIAGTPTGVGLDFVQGATAADDRLYCAYLRPSGTGAGLFYLLSSNNNLFTTSGSTLVWLFGPNTDAATDGRPASIYVRNLSGSGSTDKNLYVSTFQGDDTLHAYDATAFPAIYTSDLGSLNYVTPAGFISGGGAALEELTGSTTRAIMVGGATGIPGGLVTFDMDAMTEDNNRVAPTSTLQSGDQYQDVCRTSDGKYYVTGAPPAQASKGGRNRILKLDIQATTATPPVLTVTVEGDVDPATASWPNFNAGTEYVWGLAAGRSTANGDVLYVSTVDGTNANLYTLVPQAAPTAAKNWQDAK